MKTRSYTTRAGQYIPPGASADAGGVNFSLFARDAAAVELRLYEAAESAEPFQVIPLCADVHRTFFFWHVYVEGLPAGVHYAWGVARAGHEIDCAPEVLDPWARAVSDALWDRAAAIAGRATSRSARAIVTTPPDERRDAAAGALDLSDAVIYELHVGGFTRHSSSGVRHPGTFAG
jgi:glycogen operon protein